MQLKDFNRQNGSGAMAREWWVLLLAALFFVPSSGASPSAGAFAVEEELLFAANLSAEGIPLALFVPQTRGIGGLEIRLPNATVTEHRVTFHSIDPHVVDPLSAAVVPTRSDREWITNGTVRLLPGSHDGVFGIYPRAADLALYASGPSTWQARIRSEIGDFVYAGQRGSDDVGYAERVEGLHLLGVGNGSLRFTGLGEILLVGPDVEVQTERVTRHETGFRRTSATEEVATVLVIQLHEPATVDVHGVPFEAALDLMDVSWDGPLRFTPREGNLRSEDGRYLSSGRSAMLDGDLEARIVPTDEGRASVEVHGNVRSSTLIFEQKAPLLEPDNLDWVPLLVLGSVTLGAGGGAFVAWGVMRRRLGAPEGPALPFTPEDCQEAGAIACAEEEWAKAAEWFERGVLLAPTSARLHADLAFCLAQIGDVERALAHYAKAHALSEDGEAAFNAACAAVAAGLDAEAARWLGVALDRSPEFVVHLAEDEEWDALLATPAVDAIVAAAWERLGRWEPDSGRAP